MKKGTGARVQGTGKRKAKKKDKMKKEKKTKSMKPVAKGGGKMKKPLKGKKTKKGPSRFDRTLGNIGERKRAEERLTYQSQLLTILNDAIIASDSQYRITAWNTAAETMYGWKAEEVLGRFGLDITQTEYPGIDKTEMLRAISEVGSWRGEATQARKDGTRFPVEVSSIVLRDATGKATGFVSVNRDISGRKRAEAALLQEKAFSESVINTAQAIILILDTQGRIVRFNPYMEEVSGYPLAEVKGKDWFDTFVPERDRARIRALFHKAIDNIQTHGNANSIVTRNGSEREIEWYDKTLRDEQGNSIGLISIGQDITERKCVEEQIHASLREKEILLKEIHHRVKNNLQIISGLLTLQAAQIDDERLTKMIKESQNRIRTMALIHQMLYEAGNLSDIDMGDYIRSLAGNLISSHFQVATPPRVGFDLAPLRLAMDKVIPLALIVNELLTNALKHAFAGGQPGEIRIALQECRGTARRAPTHELIVSDNGIGLPAGFDATKQKSLGLQLVAMLVKQLNGTLAIESSGGTSVRIAFNADEKSKKQS
jgi:PAS domain S-box-containing protein